MAAWAGGALRFVLELAVELRRSRCRPSEEQGRGDGGMIGLGAKSWRLIWPIVGLTRRLTTL